MAKPVGDTDAVTSRVQNSVSRLVSVLNRATWLKLVMRATLSSGKKYFPPLL